MQRRLRSQETSDPRTGGGTFPWYARTFAVFLNRELPLGGSHVGSVPLRLALVRTDQALTRVTALREVTVGAGNHIVGTSQVGGC